MHEPDHQFRQTVYRYYREHGRHDLPWRHPELDGSFDPYKILVSEVMLQQTQAPRVIPKYDSFLRRFPTAQIIAESSLGDVLIAWQGLGYNRRAKYIWQAAQQIMGDYGGIFPRMKDELMRIPGIGPNTAGAVLAYAFNEPVVFIETNIRTVFIHHFFPDRNRVPDKSIAVQVELTLDTCDPRSWYWALMDYGAYLKQTIGNLSRVSDSYAKQSMFSGSLRQLRGKILRELANGPMEEARFLAKLDDPRAEAVFLQLRAEGLVRHTGGTYMLP